MFVLTETEVRFLCDTLRDISDTQVEFEDATDECLEILENLAEVPTEEYLDE